MTYTVEYKASALKEMKKLPKQTQLVIITNVARLAKNPMDMANVKALKGGDNYRLRIGDYRVVYSFQHKKLVIQIVKVAHRKEVYR